MSQTLLVRELSPTSGLTLALVDVPKRSVPFRTRKNHSKHKQDKAMYV